jgi:hypothetical protein
VIGDSVDIDGVVLAPYPQLYRLTADGEFVRGDIATEFRERMR